MFVASYNRIIMMGNLTRDPEYKQLTSGQAVCKLGLASNRQFKNKQTGTMIQEVCFIDVDVWGPQAESCRQYLQKGKSVLIEGRLKFDSWQDAEGNKRSKHSITADRVTFVSSGAQAEDVEGDALSASVPPVDQVITPAEPLEGARKTTRVSSKKSNETTTAAPTGEINFKDEAPFEDDLPF
jgi:single-strand DNA-binding protein